jgi:arylformamidase
MRIYDVSVPLSPTLVGYPGDPAVEITPVAQLAWGDAANVSRLTMSSHSGTHIDAPRHFFAAGIPVDTLDLHVLIGPVRVYTFPNATHITAADLQSLSFAGIQRVLFKTTNSQFWARPSFQTNYVALLPSAADFLVQQGIQLVGIDYLSIDAAEEQDFPVHRILLGAGIVILEGLDLREVPAGDYELIALPLRLRDGDGAPARVILRASD